MASPQYSGPWQRIRRAVLIRDGYTCQIRLPGCYGRATAVDHIHPVETHGPTWNPALLRAACVKCNNARRKHEADPPPSRKW